MNNDLESELVQKLRATRKYRNTCEDTLARVARWALARHESPRDALKAAKRKLHQVYGAYLQQTDLDRIEALAASIPTPGSPEAAAAACRQILCHHASTRERFPILSEAFSSILERTGAPKTVLDLACGLNPFAIPWMNLPEGARYYAFDIDRRLIAAVNDLFDRIGQTGAARCHDIFVSLPEMEADVTFLLKTLPCLEQQEKGISLPLLRRLRTRHAVVSFPAKSLGGREKGMVGHYDKFMGRLLGELGAPATRMAFPSEVFYVVNLGRSE